jgi:hypothetical protein
MFRVGDNPVLHASQFNRFGRMLKPGNARQFDVDLRRIFETLPA